VQGLGVGDGFGGGAHVGLGHDFQQRRAGAVQVDAGLAGSPRAGSCRRLLPGGRGSG
jgi:hypothetical protein